jgi:hypothetical protein
MAVPLLLLLLLLAALPCVSLLAHVVLLLVPVAQS